MVAMLPVRESLRQNVFLLLGAAAEEGLSCEPSAVSFSAPHPGRVPGPLTKGRDLSTRANATPLFSPGWGVHVYVFCPETSKRKNRLTTQKIQAKDMNKDFMENNCKWVLNI